MITMPYADADFLLALIKPDNWLKETAQRVLQAQRRGIWTSAVTLAEVLMVGKRAGLNPERMTSDIINIVEVDEVTKKVVLRAAIFMARHGLSAFDAFHAAYAMDDTIISSDHIFDKIGLKRIPLR